MLAWPRALSHSDEQGWRLMSIARRHAKIPSPSDTTAWKARTTTAVAYILLSCPITTSPPSVASKAEFGPRMWVLLLDLFVVRLAASARFVAGWSVAYSSIDYILA